MSTTSATSSSGSNGALLQLSGLASGINWTSLVNELVAAESAPITGMQAQQSTYQTQKAAYQTLGTDLTTLNNDITTLSAPGFFTSRTASSSNTSVANATATTGTALGNYTFTVTQMASDASIQGAKPAVSPLSTSATLASAGFSTPITAGTFTVNGKVVTIDASDTLATVFSKINTASGVTASYLPSSDEINLSSSSPIVLGGATDTSNFLQVAELYNNGGDTVTSTSALGGINLSADMSSSNLTTPINDGGQGQGQFLINGVAINYDASTESINDVLTSINNSSAGVTATFDAVNNRFVLTNNTTGDVGISLQDVTGNFLAATGLSGGSLQRGNNLQYNINNGGTLTSQSNTITSTSSGIPGLTVNALGKGSSSISVGSDTTTIATAIKQFVSDYNAVQNYISSETATTTNSSGATVGSTLTGDMTVEGIATDLRQLVNALPGGLSSTIQSLSDLGIASNGQDNTLAISDTSTIDTALANNLSQVQSLFTDPTSGLAATMSSYIKTLTGTTGVLATGETNFTSDVNNVGQSITALQAKVSSDQTRLTNEFVAMETAVNSINQQKQYLTDFFNSGASTASSSQSTGASGL
jgi:flagellar hook-associated protein 2